MKKQIVLLGLYIGFLFFLLNCNNEPTQPNHADDLQLNISGTWQGMHHSNTTGQTDVVTYVINQSRSNLTGQYTNNSTGGGYGISGAISGNQVTIRLTDGSYYMDLTGSVSGNAISGTLSSSSGQNGTFSITKQGGIQIYISGTWKGSHHSNTTGQTHNVTYVINQSGNNLSGQYTNNSSGGGYPITGSITENRVSIRLTDGSYYMDLTGSVNGNAISGALSSSSGQNGTFSITKQ